MTGTRELTLTKKKLRLALDALEQPAVKDYMVRRAHLTILAAADALQNEISRRDADNVAANHAHARKLAQNRRDARGHKRTPQTMPGYNKGRVPASKGTRKSYEDDCPFCHTGWRQPHKQECINPYGERIKAAMYLMWRGGLRVGCELLRLHETDLHPAEGYVFIRKGKNGKQRDVVLDDWLWPMLQPWIELRQAYPPGPLFCVLEGSTAGVRAMQVGTLRRNIHELAALAGIRHRVNPHGFRHAMALEQLLEGVNPLFISRNMGHSSLQVTDNYFQGLPQSRVVSELRSRPVPQVSMFDMLNGAGSRLEPPKTRTPDLMGALAR